jgi:hypothetical protein
MSKFELMERFSEFMLEQCSLRDSKTTVDALRELFIACFAFLIGVVSLYPILSSDFHISDHDFSMMVGFIFIVLIASGLGTLSGHWALAKLPERRAKLKLKFMVYASSMYVATTKSASEGKELAKIEKGARDLIDAFIKDESVSSRDWLLYYLTNFPAPISLNNSNFETAFNALLETYLGRTDT